MASEGTITLTAEELERLKQLPERVFMIGGKECRGVFDEAESRFFLLNEDGSFSGKSAIVRRCAPEPEEEPLEQQDDDDLEEDDTDPDDVEDGLVSRIRSIARKKVVVIPVALLFTLLLALFVVRPLLSQAPAVDAPVHSNTANTVPPDDAATTTTVEEIDVIQVLHDLKPGDVITELDIQRVSIGHDAYNQISVISDIYKWGDSDHLIGKYINAYVSAGQYLYLDSVSSVYAPASNPWKDERPETTYIEIPVSASDIDGGLVNFGAVLNLSIQKRTVSETPNASTEELTAPVDGLEHQTSVQQSVVIDSYQVSGLVVCDLLNANGESLYDYYFAYMGIPAGKQVTYLRQALHSDETLEESLGISAIQVRVTTAQASALGDLTADNVDASITFTGDRDIATESKAEFAAKAHALYDTIQNAQAANAAEREDEQDDTP